MAVPSWRAERRRLLLAAAGLAACRPAAAQEVPEYRIKAAFVYNFASFTEWPAEVGSALHLCVHGPDPFGGALATVHGRKVGERTLVVPRRAPGDDLRSCQIVFVAAGEPIARVLDALQQRPVLTVSDLPDGYLRGAMFSLSVRDGRVQFDVNLRAARAARLDVSARLLRLATEVLQ